MDRTIERSTTAAQALVEAVGDDVAQLTFPFDDPRRQSWTYLPGERHGLATVALDRPAGVALHRLLATTLSAHAHAQVTAIMGLEDPLAALQGGDYHVGDYWVALYGSPGDEAWGWRLGGHHVSVRATVVAGRLRTTPLFLGANPARILHEGIVTSQPLAPEELLGFRLLASIPDRLRAEAIIADEAPNDIVTGDATFVGELPHDVGIRLADLGGDARAVAERLVGVYLARLAEPLRRVYVDAVLPESWGDFRFAWAGGRQPGEGAHLGEGHYYRLVGPRFLAELDDTQNRANHVHTVWRDPEGDHGRDLR